MLNDETHCQMLSATLIDRSASLRSNFRMFIQLFSALVGGSAALRLQYGALIYFAILANILAILITSGCAFLICDAFRSWRGYRCKLTEVANKGSGHCIIQPASSDTENTFKMMIRVMAVALIGFVLLNPLGPFMCFSIWTF